MGQPKIILLGGLSILVALFDVIMLRFILSVAIFVVNSSIKSESSTLNSLNYLKIQKIISLVKHLSI